MADRWTASDPRWQQLTPYQRAAAMALMEADGRNPEHARNAAGAMINRATKGGQDLGEHVSQRIYQPTIEPSQQGRLPSILSSPAYQDLTGWVERRAKGQEADPVSGATHFLAKPQVMLGLEAREPSKYKNWGPRGANWTGYDETTGQYKNQTMVDGSHAFLAPEGAYSHPGSAVSSAPGMNPNDLEPSRAEPAAPFQSTPQVASSAAPFQSSSYASAIAGVLSEASKQPGGMFAAPARTAEAPAEKQGSGPNLSAPMQLQAEMERRRKEIAQSNPLFRGSPFQYA